MTPTHGGYLLKSGFGGPKWGILGPSAPILVVGAQIHDPEGWDLAILTHLDHFGGPDRYFGLFPVRTRLGGVNLMGRRRS